MGIADRYWFTSCLLSVFVVPRKQMRRVAYCGVGGAILFVLLFGIVMTIAFWNPECQSPKQVSDLELELHQRLGKHLPAIGFLIGAWCALILKKPRA